MGVSEKNIQFKGLVAYNHISKRVKQSLESQEITLKKGKYFKKGSSKGTSFRDIVNKAFKESKGKSKQEVEKITLSVISERLVYGGYIKPASKLPDEGTGYDLQKVPYWQLQDVLLKAEPAGTKVIIDNSAIGSIDSFEGKREDADQAFYSNIIRSLNNDRAKRDLDSKNIPSYSAYTDKNGVLNVVLVDNDGVPADWYGDEGASVQQIIELTEEGLGKTGGKRDKKKEKSSPVISTTKEIEAEELKQAKAVTKTKQFEAVAAEISALTALKKSAMDDYRFAKEMDDKADMKKAKAKIDSIKAKIEKLEG